MPEVTNILFQQFRNKFKNGDDFLSNPNDFTINTVGNVIEELEVITRLEVSWFAESSAVDVWNVGGSTIRRTSGNFFEDGFFIGSKFQYQSTWRSAPMNDFQAIVQSISQDGTILTFNNVVGTIPIGEKTEDAIRGMALEEENFLFGLTYKFALIGNDEDANFNSKVNQAEQVYYSNEIGLDIGGARDMQFIDLLPQQETNRSWITGNAQARFVTSLLYIQTYEIKHTFIINPYYVEGELTNLENLIVPDLLAGDNSLKYVFEANFQTTITNPNAGITAQDSNNLGSVGWFNENFNGLKNNYSVAFVEYQDVNTGFPVDGLQLTTRTRVEIGIRLEGGNFSNGQRLGFLVSYLPTQEEYTDTATDFRENFRYDSIYHVQGQAATIGTNIIKSVDARLQIIDGLIGIVIVAELEYPTSQRLNLTEDSNYIISAIIADESLENDVSDRVSLLCDVNNYTPVSFVEGLIRFPKFNFLQHNEVFGLDTGASNVIACNEDGLLIDASFELDLDNEAFINSLKISLIARSSSNRDFFELDSFDFDFSSQVVSSGIQQIEIDETRGYNLADGDQFNWARIQTGANNSGMQTYNLQIGQKISWEEWIENLDVNAVFFDRNEPNNGLNEKSSNYSDVNSYQIEVLAEADLTGVDDLGKRIAGITRSFSGIITVFDYDKDENTTPIWSAQVETLDPDTFVPIQNGSDGGLLDNKDTLFRTTWTNINGAVTDLTGFFAIHRLEVENALGKNIEELSTLIAPPSNQILKPLDGLDFLDMRIESGNVITECLIDVNGLDNFSNYKLSCRIDNGQAVQLEAMQFENGENMQFENSVNNSELQQFENQN